MTALKFLWVDMSSLAGTIPHAVGSTIVLSDGQGTEQ